jgi:hypothetical protein
MENQAPALDRRSWARIRARRWRDIERAMDHARNLRAQMCADLAAGALRALRRALKLPKLGLPLSLGRAAVLLGLLALGLALMSGPVPAQDARQIRLDGGAGESDKARLAALGLDADAIESATDVATLWRAVRELVLPGRVSETLQQRILRRVWMADEAIREAPIIAGTDH